MDEFNPNSPPPPVGGEPQEASPFNPNQLPPTVEGPSDVERKLSMAHQHYLEHGDEYWGRDTAGYMAERTPGVNIAQTIWRYAGLRSALQGMKSGKPSDDDINELAQYKAKQDYEAQKSAGGQAVDMVSHVPGLVAEFAASGGIGTAARVGATEAAGRVGLNALGAKAAGYAAGLATQTALTPSLYLDKAVNNNIQADRDPLDPRGLPAAYGLAVAQMAVLGAVGKVTGAAFTGEGLGHAAGRVGVQAATGPFAQAATDVVTSFVGLDTGYGNAKRVLDGNYGEALQHAAMDALQFGAFGVAHELVGGGHSKEVAKQAAEKIVDVLKAEKAKGSTPEEAAQALRDSVAPHMPGTPTGKPAESADAFKEAFGVALPAETVDVKPAIAPADPRAVATALDTPPAGPPPNPREVATAMERELRSSMTQLIDLKQREIKELANKEMQIGNTHDEVSQMLKEMKNKVKKLERTTNAAREAAAAWEAQQPPKKAPPSPPVEKTPEAAPESVQKAPRPLTGEVLAEHKRLVDARDKAREAGDFELEKSTGKEITSLIADNPGLRENSVYAKPRKVAVDPSDLGSQSPRQKLDNLSAQLREARHRLDVAKVDESQSDTSTKAEAKKARKGWAERVKTLQDKVDTAAKEIGPRLPELTPEQLANRPWELKGPPMPPKATEPTPTPAPSRPEPRLHELTPDDVWFHGTDASHAEMLREDGHLGRMNEGRNTASGYVTKEASIAAKFPNRAGKQPDGSVVVAVPPHEGYKEPENLASIKAAPEQTITLSSTGEPQQWRVIGVVPREVAAKGTEAALEYLKSKGEKVRSRLPDLTPEQLASKPWATRDPRSEKEPFRLPELSPDELARRPWELKGPPMPPAEERPAEAKPPEAAPEPPKKQSLMDKIRARQEANKAKIKTPERPAEAPRAERDFTTYKPPTEHELAGLTKAESFAFDQGMAGAKPTETAASNSQGLNSKQAVEQAFLRAAKKLGKIDPETGKPKSRTRLLAERSLEKADFNADGTARVPIAGNEEAVQNLIDELAAEGTYLTPREAQARLQKSADFTFNKEESFQSLWREYFEEAVKRGREFTPEEYASLNQLAADGKDPPANEGKKYKARQRKREKAEAKQQAAEGSDSGGVQQGSEERPGDEQAAVSSDSPGVPGAATRKRPSKATAGATGPAETGGKLRNPTFAEQVGLKPEELAKLTPKQRLDLSQKRTHPLEKEALLAKARGQYTIIQAIRDTMPGGKGKIDRGSIERDFGKEYVNGESLPKHWFTKKGEKGGAKLDDLAERFGLTEDQLLGKLKATALVEMDAHIERESNSSHLEYLRNKFNEEFLAKNPQATDEEANAEYEKISQGALQAGQEDGRSGQNEEFVRDAFPDPASAKPAAPTGGAGGEPAGGTGGGKLNDWMEHTKDAPPGTQRSFIPGDYGDMPGTQGDLFDRTPIKKETRPESMPGQTNFLDKAPGGSSDIPFEGQFRREPGRGQPIKGPSLVDSPTRTGGSFRRAISDFAADEAGSLDLDKVKEFAVDAKDRFLAGAKAVSMGIRSFGHEMFPATHERSQKLGDKMSTYATSRTQSNRAKPYYIDKVLGENVTPEQGKLWMTTLQESRLRYAAAEAKARGDIEAEQRASRSFVGTKGSALPDEATYQATMKDPEFVQMVQRYKDDFVPVMEEYYKQATGRDQADDIDSLTQIPGLPIPFKAIRESDKAGTTLGPSGSGSLSDKGGLASARGSLNAQKLRKLGASNDAKFSADEYETDFREVISHILDTRIETANKHEMFRAAVAEGQAHWDFKGPERKRAEDGTMRRLMPNVEPPKGTQENKGRQTSLYVDESIWHEMKNALNMNEPGPGTRMVRKATNLINAANLFVSTGEILSHGTNQVTMFLTKPGMRYSDLFSNIRSAYEGNAAFKKKMMDLARIGADKPSYSHEENRSLLKAGSRLLDGLSDVMRATASDAYDRLAAQKIDGKPLFKDTAAAKRNFVNQLGQYERRSQNGMVRWARDSGVGPFATAGTNYIEQSIGALSLNPGIKGEGVYSKLYLRANLLKNLGVAAGTVMAINYALWGRLDGDDRTPWGNIKIGESGGKTRSIDVSAPFLIKRGLRTTGLLSMLEGQRGAAPAASSFDKATDDVMHAFLHPSMGPAAQFALEAATGKNTIGMQVAQKAKEGQSQKLLNVKAAVLNANPIVAEATGTARPDDKRPVGERALDLLGPFAPKVRQKAIGAK